MKITSFNPLILTSNAEEVIRTFEALGFMKKHTNTNVDGKDITNFTLADANGYKVDVASSAAIKQDLTMIRMNVDDFDEAYAFFIGRGFKMGGDHVVESKSSKSAMMISPSGFAFDLCHHIKNHD